MTAEWLLLTGLAAAGPAPTGLLTELLARPELTVIPTARPSFGWVVEATGLDQVQTAYQILVASSEERLERDEGDWWDSGRIESSQSINLVYAGAPLPPGQTCWWQVRTWDQHGRAGAWSAPQRFTLAAELPEYATARYPLQTTARPTARMVALAPGHWFIDFGRAMFGWLELEGDYGAGELTVHLGEKLDGERIDRRPPGSVRYARSTIATTPGWRVYRAETPADPRNTSGAAIRLPAELGVVLPFRYAEVEGAAELTETMVWRVAVHYPFDREAAEFRCSDETLNALWELCRDSIEATSFAGVYVDGDRERIPYEADAYINQLSHYAVDREFSLARYSHEYLLEHPTWPTEWKFHSIMLAWADYQQTGDARSLLRHYDVLVGKLLREQARDDGLLDTRDLRDIVDWPAGERDDYDFRPVNTVVNAFSAHCLALMAEIAQVTGREADAATWRDEAAQAAAAIETTLRDPASGLYLDGEGSTHSSQHANMLPLAFGLTRERREPVVEHLLSRGTACSVYGAQYLLEALYAAGEAQAALDLLRADGERSWVNMLRQGATITWEAWDQRFKPNQDLNHAWGAAPGNVIARCLVGLRPLEAGYGRMRIAPAPGDLDWFAARLPTIRGLVTVNYRRGERLEVDLPANTTAVIECFGRRAEVGSGRHAVVP